MKQRNYKDLERKNIVILGAGFVGIRTALDLNNYLSHDSDYDIILIDRRDYQVYFSALYEAATTEHGLVEAKKVKKTVTIPLAQIFKNTRVKVFKAYIDSVELENGMVVTDSRILNYNYLVVALGSIPDFYGIPSLEKYGFTLKSLEDAIMIRNRIEAIVTKKDSGRIVIGGGGFAGTEFAGELHNLIKHECQHHNKKCENFEIMIVEGATALISSLPSNVSKMIADRLGAMGIKLKFSSLISEVGSNYVVLNKQERFDSDLLIWTGGVRSMRLPGKSEIDRDKKDRISTTEFLNLKKLSNVFIAGDDLGFVDPGSKKPLPQTAQEAIRHGKLVAKNIYRMIKRKPLHPYQPGNGKYVIPLAGKYAIFYSKNIVIGGFLGWTIRRLADLNYLLSILPFFGALSMWLFENNIFVKND
jgi:NADH dehydrogenase